MLLPEKLLGHYYDYFYCKSGQQTLAEINRVNTEMEEKRWGIKATPIRGGGEYLELAYLTCLRGDEEGE